MGPREAETKRQLSAPDPALGGVPSPGTQSPVRPPSHPSRLSSPPGRLAGCLRPVPNLVLLVLDRRPNPANSWKSSWREAQELLNIKQLNNSSLMKNGRFHILQGNQVKTAVLAWRRHRGSP